MVAEDGYTCLLPGRREDQKKQENKKKKDRSILAPVLGWLRPQRPLIKLPFSLQFRIVKTAGVA